MKSKDNRFHSAIDRLRLFTGKYGKRTSRTILVALCVGLIIYFMPKEKSVYYDFKLNAPWAHEQLRAEFDFDVPKTQEEMAAEADSIKERLIPIFQRVGLPNNFHDAAIAASFANTTDMEEKRIFFDKLKKFFERGIIDDNDTVYLNRRAHSRILTYRDSTDRRRLESRDFITISEARRALLGSMADTTGMTSYIKPNYRCDTRASQQELKRQIDAISPVSKHMKEGERIISTGDIVDKETEATVKTYLEKKKEKEKTRSANNRQNILIGQIIFIVVCMLILLAYISTYKKEISNNANKFIFTILSATVFPILVGIVTSYGGISIFIIPFAILPITLCLFIDDGTAFVTSCISLAMCSVMLTSPYEFMLLQILS